jgi:pimeloyl-ACP methyl ester carboxylesterase
MFCAGGADTAARSDTIMMKSGVILKSQGPPDKDGTLLYMWDGLRKIVIRDSRVDRIVGDNAFRTGEKFSLEQPLVVHAGSMPKEVISVEAGPWNDRGRRSFRYVGSRSSRPVDMEQAIIELGPHLARYRGVNGFWLGQVATSQVPRDVIMSILSRVEQKNQSERERVVRFLMDASWYSEARQELDRIIKDFPDDNLKERAAGARAFIIQAEANQRRAEVDVRRRALQFQAATKLLKSFTEKEIGAELLIEVRDQVRRIDEQQVVDQAQITDLRKLEGTLSSADRGNWKKRVAEVVQSIEQAPEAVRERFLAWRKARATSGSSKESQFALAMSGYIVGSDAAVADPKTADTLWRARDLIHDYLAEPEAVPREEMLAKLEELAWPEEAGVSKEYRVLDLATRIVRLMPPPLHDPKEKPERTIKRQVIEDGSTVPTEYVVRLPPEYHPLRSYPAIMVLHSGAGPSKAIESWQAEAARRGYILIAPEYNIPGESHDYRFTPSEHAAAELALRDARRRYAIDGDRVFVTGQLTGAHMAWDLALGHPDLFAGAAVISGFPAKYVPRMLSHHQLLPLYFVIGDLAPAANEVVYGSYVKPLILKAWDVTYIEYSHRGIEEFPEEIPSILDWMDHHRRDPLPRSFEIFSARDCDARFHGIVIQEFTQGRTTSPVAVEMLGQNLSPAKLRFRTSSLSNLINLKTDGVKQLDVWVSPKIIDFKRKMEVRINDRPFAKGQIEPSLEDFLEDIRLRGDRQQVYWLKVTAG